MPEKRFFSNVVGMTILFILLVAIVVFIVLAAIGTIPVWAGATFAPLCYVLMMVVGFNTTEEENVHQFNSEPRRRAINPILGIIGINMVT